MCSEKTVTLYSVCGEGFVPADKPKKVGNYILGRILGEGRCGIVREAVGTINQEKVAVKALVKYRSSKGNVQRQCFRREVDSLRRLRHPNVIALYETMETARCMYLVLELVDGRTLAELLKQRGMLQEVEARLVMQQLTSAIQHVHRNDVIHRDIKPANILVKRDNGLIKLIDFGLSTTHLPGSVQTRQCGTPVYSAPEIYTGVQYGPAVDVWSLGVILFEMLTGRTPFITDRPRNLSQLYGTILRTVVIPSSFTHDCALLVKSLLQFNPENRPSSDQILSHPWIIELCPLHNHNDKNRHKNSNNHIRPKLSPLTNMDHVQHQQCESVRLFIHNTTGSES